MKNTTYWSDYDEEEDVKPTVKKQKHRKQKFRVEWLQHEVFKYWLDVDDSNPYFARCTVCKRRLTAELSVLRKHADAEKHKRNLMQIPLDQFVGEEQEYESNEEKDINPLEEEILMKELNEMTEKENSKRSTAKEEQETHCASFHSDEERNKTPIKEVLPSVKRIHRIFECLKGIEQQLETRNHIEEKKLLFKIAKFKFLNPSFSFDNDDAS